MQFLPRCSGALALIALAGCDPSPTTPRIQTRPGVSLVYEGPAVSDVDCIFRNSESGVCPTWTDLMIQDVKRDGDHVAVLFYLAVPGGRGIMLAESDDLGKTWRSRGFGSPLTDLNSPSLYLSGGKTYIMWIGNTDGPLGGRLLGVRWDVDDSPTGYTQVTDTGVIHQLIYSADGRARTFLGPVDFNDPRGGFHDISWAPGEQVATYGTRCAGVYGCTNPSLLTADGVTYVGTFDPAMAIPGGTSQQHCTYRSNPFDVSCVPWETWPAATAQNNDPPSTVIHEGNGSYSAARFYELNGRAYVQRIVPGSTPQLGPLLDLDVGRPPKFGDLPMYASYRQRFPGMTGVIRENGYMELYRLRGIGGVDRVVFPDSPCATLASCAEIPFLGYGQATFMLPLEGDEALIFYVVDTYLDDVSNHQFMYVSRETITYEEVHAPEENPDVLYPGWRNASDVEQMCARAAACYPNAGINVSYCAGWWSATSSNEPGAEAALATFLATPPGCAGFATSWPELTVSTGTCSATCPRCENNAFVQVCANVAPCGVACTRRGGTCVNGSCSLSATTAECDSCTSDGRAVSCGTVDSVLAVTSVASCTAGGYTCNSNGPSCQNLSSCSADGYRCDGTTSIGCFNGVEAKSDCAEIGRVCDSTGQCMPNTSSPTCGQTGAECRGSVMWHCADQFSQWMRTDCAALGFSTCVKDTQTGFARCE